ncbi:hypothetical protein ES707_15319 [subsurface metagenome]
MAASSNSRFQRSCVRFWNAALLCIDNVSHNQGFACCRRDARRVPTSNPAWPFVRYRPRPVVHEWSAVAQRCSDGRGCHHCSNPRFCPHVRSLPGLARCSDTRRSRAAAEPLGAAYPPTRPSSLSRRSFATRAALLFRYGAQSRSDAATRVAPAAGPGPPLFSPSPCTRAAAQPVDLALLFCTIGS